MSAEINSTWRSAARDAGTETAQPSPAPVAQAGGFPALGGGGRGVGAGAQPQTVLREFNPVSWFHPRGIYRVLARLQPRLPDVGGKLFLTFTFNPALFADPLSAFEHGRDRLRRLFFKLRRGVTWEGKRYVVDAPYAVKIEFHQNGWAHFHVVFLTRSYLPGGLLNALWTLGRTNVRRISTEKFRYLLKYVTKGGGLPDWVLGRTRLRVFQSSRGFLKTSAEVEPTAPSGDWLRKRRNIRTIGERLQSWSKTALLESGHSFKQVILGAPFFDLVAELILPAALERRYLGRGHFLVNGISELAPWIIPRN